MITTRQARWEQFRQSRQIHSGLARMLAVALAVRLARIPIPSRRLRERLYRKVFGAKYRALNEQELERPLADFSSLNALFTRGVRPECRPISECHNQLICPCDGVVQEVGSVQQDSLLTVKGTRYSLETLLPETDTSRYHNGWFAVLFLSPSDCHRVFAPDTSELCELVHVPGFRLLVHPEFQNNEYPVFTLNERVIFQFSNSVMNYAMVMVAGWGVGNITSPLGMKMPFGRTHCTRQVLTPRRTVQRGDWIATFELGSTVILLVEPKVALTAEIARGQSVQYGQPAFRWHV